MATNLAVNPEDFTAANWLDVDRTITANATTAPDGTVTADQIAPDGANADVVTVGTQDPLTIPTSTNLVAGFFVKNVDRNWCSVRIGSLGSLDIKAWYDVNNGVLGTANADVNNHFIDEMPFGFYRCALAFTSHPSDSSGSLFFGLADSDTDLTVVRNSTESLYFWGSFLHEGTTPQPYLSEAGIYVPSQGGNISGLGLSFGKMGMH